MDTGDDPYQILGLSNDNNSSIVDVVIDSSQIKQAYRELARTHHPDRNIHNDVGTNDGTMFAKITHAYDILINDDSRLSYDLSQKAYYKNSKLQKGYDPNGPRYSSSSSPRATHSTTSTSTPYPTTTSTTTSSPNVYRTPTGEYQKTTTRPVYVCRMASTTTKANKETGESNTFTYETTSDGMTTVDVKSSPSGTTKRLFSGPETDNNKDDVYQMFKDHFGIDAANQFFPSKNNGDDNDNNNIVHNHREKLWRQKLNKELIERKKNKDKDKKKSHKE